MGDAARLKRMARERAKTEARALRSHRFSNMDDNRAGMARIDQAYEDTVALIEACQVPAGVPQSTERGWRASRDAIMAAIEFNIVGPGAPHMRAARIQNLAKVNETRQGELHRAKDMSAHDALMFIDDLADKAEKVAHFFANLGKDPAKYYGIVERFVNKEVFAVARANRIKIAADMTMQATEEIVDMLKASPNTAKAFKMAGQLFEYAAKFLGVLQVGIEAVALIFKAAADGGNWAEIIVKGTHSIAVAVTFSAIASAAVVEEAIASSLAPIFVTALGFAEVPPAAVAIAAAGLVVLATWAVTELASAVFDWMFGLTDMPPRMMISTAMLTHHETVSRTSLSTIHHT